MRRTIGLVLALLLLTLPQAVAKPASDELAAARDHYRRGTTLYDLGKYDEAVAEFQQAYEIRDDPVLLYNIAQSYRLSNKYEKALNFYKTYLRRAPRAPNREDVEAKIADMEKLIEQQKNAAGPPVDPIRPKAEEPPSRAAPPTEPKAEAKEEAPAAASTKAEDEGAPIGTAPPAPPASPGRGKLIGGIVVGVLGLGALAAGIGLGVSAMGKAREQESLDVHSPGLEETGTLFQNVGIALDVAGGVLVVTGIVLAAVGAAAKAPVESHAALRPVVSPRSAGFAISF